MPAKKAPSKAAKHKPPSKRGPDAKPTQFVRRSDPVRPGEDKDTGKPKKKK
jgi:hypothetical protein